MDRYKASLKAIAANIPPTFLRRVRDVLQQVYAEAHSRTFADPLFAKSAPEAHDLIGQERHFIFQAKLAGIAKECGLSCATARNRRGTASYRMVRAGQFILT